MEYGRNNSKVLVLFHVLYYLACLGEAIVLNKSVNTISFFGVGLFAFSMVMLWIVIFSLKDIWTVKLIIARNTDSIVLSFSNFSSIPIIF